MRKNQIIQERDEWKSRYFELREKHNDLLLKHSLSTGALKVIENEEDREWVVSGNATAKHKVSEECSRVSIRG